MTKLEYAQLFLSLGIAVIPLRHRGKEPASHMMGGTWERYKTLLPTEFDVKNWLWSGWQNYGVVAGHNNIAILDFDDMAAFDNWNKYFETVIKPYKVIELDNEPFMVRSNRGVHVYIRLLEAGITNQARAGVDVKIHGYVVGPGSTHPSGSTYTALNHTFYFPDVYSLEAILPNELFPMVERPEVSTPTLTMTLPTHTEYAAEYDPFEAASKGTGGIDLITKVKSAVRIETFFPDRRQTSGDGKWWAAKCPFHQDNSPSMWIDAYKQICGCYVCNMLPLDVINLYSRIHNVTDSQAVKMLARELGVTQ